jgi:hypothetical protein
MIPIRATFAHERRYRASAPALILRTANSADTASGQKGSPSDAADSSELAGGLLDSRFGVPGRGTPVSPAGWAVLRRNPTRTPWQLPARAEASRRYLVRKHLARKWAPILPASGPIHHGEHFCHHGSRRLAHGTDRSRSLAHCTGQRGTRPKPGLGPAAKPPGCVLGQGPSCGVSRISAQVPPEEARHRNGVDW